MSDDLSKVGVCDLNDARKHDAMVWDRMEALVRKCHALTDYDHPLPDAPFIGKAVTSEEQWLANEARAIVALLPEPVDADEQYARDLIRDHGWSDMGNIGIEAVTIMIAKAHREGRALERDSREG